MSIFKDCDIRAKVGPEIDELSNKILETKSDIGIAFDSDGDRVTFMDKYGQLVSNDKMLVILTKYLCKEELEKLGIEVIFEKTGHTYIKKRVIEEKAIIGGEITGHYFYRFLNGRDDGIITALLVLNIIIEEGNELTKLMEKIPIYFITDDIRITLDENKRNELYSKVKDDIMKKDYKVDFSDGIKMYTEDNSWALVRKSITEPLLSLIFEVKDKNKLNCLINTFLDCVPELKEIVLKKIES